MLDEVSTVVAVAPGLADGGMLGGGVFDEDPARDRALHARGGDQHGQQQADGVDDDAPLASDDLLAGVDALVGRGDLGGGLDALGVDDTGGRILLPAFLAPDLAPQQAVELVKDILFLPAGEVCADGVPVRVVVREIAPGNPGPVHLEHRVQQTAQVMVGRPADVQATAAALGPPGGQDRFDRLLTGIGQVAGIPTAFGHDPGLPTSDPAVRGARTGARSTRRTTGASG